MLLALKDVRTRWETFLTMRRWKHWEHVMQHMCRRQRNESKHMFLSSEGLERRDVYLHSSPSSSPSLWRPYLVLPSQHARLHIPPLQHGLFVLWLPSFKVKWKISVHDSCRNILLQFGCLQYFMVGIYFIPWLPFTNMSLFRFCLEPLWKMFLKFQICESNDVL